MAFDEEEFPDESFRQAEQDSNKNRIDSWKRTLTYQTYQEDRVTRRKVETDKMKDPVDPEVPRYIRKLRIRNYVSEKEIITIYNAFINNIQTEEQLTEFLSYLPESNGGLYPIAVTLFHASEAVRIATAKLFRGLDSIQPGFIENGLRELNFFLYLAFMRLGV